MDEEIQVFLQDLKGSADELGIINPSVTNNSVGNINLAVALDYHDVTFEQATILVVGYVGSVSPVDSINPDQEVKTDSPVILLDEQGFKSIDFASQFQFGKASINAVQSSIMLFHKHY